MPIYEYYCGGCHTLLNFFSRTLTPGRKPVCPHCGRRGLERQVSMFAAARKQGEEGGSDDDGLDIPGMDEQKMERAMEVLASEADGIHEDDPKAAAQLMRKFSNMAGVEFNEGIEQALRRLEAGEDPDAIEADMGDVLEDADPFIVSGGARTRGGRADRFRGAPRRDETLYDL